MVSANSLLKIILLLVLVWVALDLLGEIVGTLAGPFDGIIGLLIIALIALFLLDRL